MTTIADPSINYWDLLDSYKAGIQPVFPEQRAPEQKVETPRKGLTEVFASDTLGTHDNWQMESIITKYSAPRSGTPVASDPTLMKYVQACRVRWYLDPLFFRV